MPAGEFFTVLQKQGALADKAARFYVASVVATFTHLHGLNVVYRDLKPYARNGSNHRGVL